jgi:4-amino-4-deoxy-L-arabinose transferase-like glycosyltransferase
MRYALPLLFVVLSVVSAAEREKEPQALTDYTVTFARENGLSIVRKRDVKVVQYDSPEDMSEKTGLPLLTPDGKVAVARVGLEEGIVMLGRKGEEGREDLYYEIAKYRFWPMNWMEDEKKWRAVAEKFMRGWLDRSRAK